MPRLTSGKNFKRDVIEAINELYDFKEQLERMKLNPSNAGINKMPNMLDLSGLVTREELQRILPNL